MAGNNHIRSLLFCPANRKEKLDKAIKSNADLVIYDLEDAVSHKNKKSAREILSDWLNKLKKETFERIAVRINSIDKKDSELDIEMLLNLKNTPKYLVLPKIESENQVSKTQVLTSKLNIKIIPLIETAKGVVNIEKILDQKYYFDFLMVGNADLSADIGCDNSRANMQYSNSKILLHCAAHNISVIDSPFFALNNIANLKIDTKLGKLIGFSARSAIHPQQIDIINKIYSYTNEQIAEAKRILELANNGAVKINNKMIDEAMLRKADKLVNNTNCVSKLPINILKYFFLY